jgi:hypothetical protein
LDNLSVRFCLSIAEFCGGEQMNTVSDDEIERSKSDPRFKQVLLARNLEQLLASLHKLQHSGTATPTTAQHLREGALVAVDLADRIHAIDEQLKQARKAG